MTTQVNSAGPTVTVASGLTWLPMGSGSRVPSPESDAFLLPSPDETAGSTLGGSSTPPGVSAMASGALPGDARLLGSLTYGNGLVLQRSFTSDGDLDWLNVSDPAATPGVFLLSRQHVRSNQLDLTGIWDQAANANSQTFAYTDADRLQSGVGPWGTLTYGYDASGNRTAESLVFGGTTQNDAYSYVAGTNRLDHVDHNGTLFRSFTSDVAGNIVAETRWGTAYAYLHNQNGRLSEIDVSGTPTAAYLYDALERLSVRTTMNMTPAGTTHFISDPAGHILAEADATGATQREYIWLDDLPLAVVANVPTTPTLWYVHADHLGRPIRMSDATKAIVWSAEWLPFGGVQSITGSASLDLRFPGQWFQIEAGLGYNWHPHYDASSGRYVEPDPIALSGGAAPYGY